MTISPGTLAGDSARHPLGTLAAWALVLVGAFPLTITLVPDALDGDDGPIQTLESERALRRGSRHATAPIGVGSTTRRGCGGSAQDWLYASLSRTNSGTHRRRRSGPFSTAQCRNGDGSCFDSR